MTINTPVKGHGLDGGTVVGSHNGEGVGAHRSLAGPVEYREFLARKIRLDQGCGFEVPLEEINPALKPFTRAIVQWALRGGRRGIFAKFGLHKTATQIEIMRQIGARAAGLRLIVLPLGVRQEFRLDSERLFAGSFSAPVKFIRSNAEIDDERSIYLTNYESVREGVLDLAGVRAISLDEAAVLRSFGSKTFGEFLFGPAMQIEYRFVATATPDPNEFLELIAYAHFLGVMDMGEAKTRFFKRNSEKADELTLHPHKEEEFWLWVASWAMFVQRPSDLGFSDDGYVLPEIDVRWHEIPTDHAGAGSDKSGQARMFKNAAIGVSDAAREKRDSLQARVAKLLELRAEKPEAHRLIWHDLEAEREAIQAACPHAAAVYGTQDLETREQLLMGFRNGEVAELAAKPVMLGAGGNLQRHCWWSVFLGIGHKFNDFIQAIHRLQRFGQPHRVRVDLIYTEAEREIRRSLEAKWARHEQQALVMADIIKKYGLSHAAMVGALTRAMGCERQEASGKSWRLVNNDCVEEAFRMEANSVGLIVTSIPFSTQYEYSPSYNDFGHTDNAEHFFEQMDFLIPQLLRVLKPGRVAAIHCKDRVMPGAMTGVGFQTIYRFESKVADRFEQHGFHFLGRKVIATDVVRENAQTYRLGWTEVCKDGSRMGCGMPEYLLLFRKPPTEAGQGYADQRVTRSKEQYTRARWQFDAHAFQRSSGDRLLAPEDLAALPEKEVYRLFRKYSLENVYDFERDVAIAEALDAKGKLPPTFQLLPPQSWHPDIWTDVTRMRTLNTDQAAKSREKHLCPLQFDVADRAIVLYSNEGEVVWDPFAGLGTVPLRAVKLKRFGLGCELATLYWRDSLWYLRAADNDRATPSLFDLEAA
jgi:DNA modification methylase